MARQRGLELLKANLTPDQLDQFLAYRRFDVVGGVTGRTYRIRLAVGPMHVEELDRQGRCVRRLCFYPRGRLVYGDIMLAQKVALEAFEVEALAIANKFRQPGCSWPEQGWRRLYWQRLTTRLACTSPAARHNN
jgi:hypothetical protein